MTDPTSATGANPNSHKSAVQIADELLGQPHIPRDEFDIKRPSSMSADLVRQLIIQAVNMDRDQNAPEPDAMIDHLLSQYPARPVWAMREVRIAMKTLLIMAQSSGARLS